MTSFRALGLLAASILLASSFAAPARAGLLQEFTCFGSVNLTCEGTIGFSEPNSDIIGAELTVFEVLGELLGTSFSFGLQDVDTASWSLDPVDWTIESINVQALDMTQLVFAFSWFEPQRVAASCQGVFPPGICDPDESGTIAAFAIVDATSVSIPEPATLTLFAGGLAGLLGWAWRRRRSS